MFLVGNEFFPETLMKIKEILPNVKITHWNGDDDIKFENYTVPYSAIVDYTFMSQLQFSKLYKKYGLKIFDTLAVDIENFKPMNLKKKHDVVFVGSDKADRADFLKYLVSKRINFQVYGRGWDKYPEIKPFYKGTISDEDFVTLINETKINLCFSKNYFNSPHVLERTLEMNSCKSFALTEYVKGYFPKFVEGKDIATFKNNEELAKKINYYLKHEKEREKIAERAYRKVIKRFSNQKMMGDAYKAIEKDKQPLHSITSRKYLNKKIIYLGKNDFKKGLDHLKEEVKNFEYICFKNKGYETLPYKDYFQVYTMELVKKPISICDLQLSSRLIGDYAYLGLHYVYKYYDKKYFYENVDISQFMVKKDFFLKNFKKFASLCHGDKPYFINDKTTTFISIPLVRTRKIKKIPLKNIDHILFLNLERDLVVLRSQKRLLKDPYIYKLIFYSIFINPQILKQLLVNVSRKTKIPLLVRIGEFFNRVF